MTLTNTSLSNYITGKIRNNITDPNLVNRHAQFGNWVFSDKPKIVKLLNQKNNFPRISVESITSNTVEDMGMELSDQLETAPLKITVWTVTDLICDVKSTSEEEHIYLTGTNKYLLSNIPTSNISLVTGTLSAVSGHTFIKGTDYQLIDNTSNGFYDTIEWLGTDKPDNNTIIYISYQRRAAGDELCRFIAQEINKYLRDNWRDWTERIVWSYKKTGGTPIDFDTDIGVHRYELTISFEGINIGDII